jgi:hypothetical protein
MATTKTPARPPVKPRTRRMRLAQVAAVGTLALAAAAGGGAVATTLPVRCNASGPDPDKSCTPGALSPSVTQSNIQQTICASGYTATIRPPVSYTDPLKAELMRSYGLSGAASAYELDHFVSLELGGNPTSLANLWPEAYLPTPGAHEKDKVENYLRGQVCGGHMTLVEAQRQITSDWLAVWNSIKP